MVNVAVATRHVVGQCVVSDVSVFVIIEVFRPIACILNTNLLLCLLIAVQGTMYFASRTKHTIPYNMPVCTWSLFSVTSMHPLPQRRTAEQT